MPAWSEVEETWSGRQGVAHALAADRQFGEWTIVGSDEFGAPTETMANPIEVRDVVCGFTPGPPTRDPAPGTPKTCRAVGDEGTVWQSPSATGAWEVLVQLDEGSPRLNAISPDETVVVGDAGTLYYGFSEHWRLVETETDADFYAATNGWVVGEGGAIMARIGSAWQVVESGVAADLVSIVQDPDGVWIGGTDGTLLRSNFEGTGVVEVTPPTDGTLHLALDSRGLYLVGDDGVIHKYASEEWEVLAEGRPGPFVDLAIWPGEDEYRVAGLRADGTLLQWIEHAATPFVPAHARCVVGRPLFIGGILLLPETIMGPPLTVDPSVITLAPAIRKELARHWCEMGRGEHASIFAFQRFVRQLQGLGAPQPLLDLATRAIADETHHAKLCFALASRYAGQSVRAGSMPKQAQSPVDLDIIAAAVAAFQEGCVGETIAAFEAGVAAQYADDPTVKQSLDIIAADERRHAALSWSFVRWCITQHGDAVRTAIKREIAKLAPNPAPDLAASSDTDAALLAHGCLPPTERQRCREAALAEVILPAAKVLCASGSARCGEPQMCM